MFNDKQKTLIPYFKVLNGIKQSSFLFILIILLINVNSISSQYRPKWPSPILQREIFILNLEDGYFACQVNDSTDFLQLFELSRLCDGKPQCFKGSDELHADLKCTDRNQCHPKQPICTNGVCLDNLCYCNDGFGGKGCDLPDENECKYRPCDIFAHCTNSLGSFFCTCYPGYTGDGFSCNDVNECEDPILSSFCSDNTECCNLPGSFTCKCLPGFKPVEPKLENGTHKCIDINECVEDQNSCGRGALCTNNLGSFECKCLPGFTGDPLKECWDIDECKSNPCGQVGAICENLPGDYSCSCKEGYKSNGNNPKDGCIDIDECLENENSCGQGAICTNTEGSHYCSCLPGKSGDPRVHCLDINECTSSTPCGPGAICENLDGGSPGYQCRCPEDYIARGSAEYGCDKPECENDDMCIGNARCLNNFCYCPPPYLANNNCTCPPNYINDPYAGCLSKEEPKINYAECTDKVICPANTVCYRGLCSRKDTCSTNKDCYNDSVCKLVNENVGFQCVDPCDTVQCGPNSICNTTDHQASCKCKDGYTAGNPNDLIFGCSSGSSSSMTYCEMETDCDQKSVCKPNFAGAKVCMDVCDQTQCGPNAFCRGVNKKAECLCANKHFEGNPYDLGQGCTLPSSAHLCTNDEDCSPEKSCILTLEGVRNCIDVCKHHQCSEGSSCVVKNHRPLCECASGFARVSSPGPNGSILGACEAHQCSNDFECNQNEHCILNQRGLLDCVPVCLEKKCGPNSDCIPVFHQPICRCMTNFEGNPLDLMKGCQKIAFPREPRICNLNIDCGDAEECIQGQCRFLCVKDSECIVGERCLDNFCVPIKTRVTINLPPKNQPYEGPDKKKEEDTRFITLSTESPSTSSDQKIIQPELKPSSFPHLKTDTSIKKQPIDINRPDDKDTSSKPIGFDDVFLPPKIDDTSDINKIKKPQKFGDRTSSTGSTDTSLGKNHEELPSIYNPPDYTSEKPFIQPDFPSSSVSRRPQVDTSHRTQTDFPPVVSRRPTPVDTSPHHRIQTEKPSIDSNIDHEEMPEYKHPLPSKDTDDDQLTPIITDKKPSVSADKKTSNAIDGSCTRT